MFRSVFVGFPNIDYYETYLRESDNFVWDFLTGSGAGAWSSNPSADARKKQMTAVDPALLPGVFYLAQTQDMGSPNEVTRLVWDGVSSRYVLGDQWRIIDGVRIGRDWHPNFDTVESGIRWLKAFRENFARIRGKVIQNGSKKRFLAYDNTTPVLDMEFPDLSNPGIRTPTSLLS